MTTVSFLVKIISIRDEELFSVTYVDCTATYFVMYISATAALYSKMYSFGMTLVFWSF